MRKKQINRICCALTIIIVLAACPVLTFAAETEGTTESGSPAAVTYPDMPAAGHWSHDALQAAVQHGILQGNNGMLLPETQLTRAQLAAMMNRVFSFEQKADISAYTDVNPSAWYYDDMAKAVAAGTFQGSGGVLRPEEPITRQEAFVVYARALKLTEGNVSVLDSFQDGSSVASWAKPLMAVMIEAGYIHGSNGSLNPDAAITKAEFAQILYNTKAYDTPAADVPPAVTPEMVPGGEGAAGGGGGAAAATYKMTVIIEDNDSTTKDPSAIQGTGLTGSSTYLGVLGDLLLNNSGKITSAYSAAGEFRSRAMSAYLALQGGTWDSFAAANGVTDVSGTESFGELTSNSKIGTAAEKTFGAAFTDSGVVYTLKVKTQAE